MGLEDTHHIGRIVVHPTNPDVVYVAALGHLWGPNKERGLFKTTDGGKTWTNTKFVDEDTGFVDVVMDPESPQTLYAASYQRRRTPFGFNGGGPGSALWKTTDGGRDVDEAHRAGCRPKATSAASASTSTAATRASSTRSSSTARTAASTAPTTAARRGRRCPTPTRARPTTARSASIRTTTSASGSWARPYFLSEDGGKTFRQDVGEKIHGDYHALWIDPAELEPPDGGHRRRRRTSPTTAAGPGTTSTTCRSASSTRSALRHAEAVPRLRRPAGQRELVRPEPHPLPAGHLATTTGSAWAAATGSTTWSIRSIPTSSTPRARTATCRASTCARASAAASAPSRRKASGTASTGTRRS